MHWLLDFYPIEDLLSEGNLALVKAKETFRPNLGYKFTTYSTKCIYQFLMDFHRRESKVKGHNLYNYKRKRPVTEKIDNVDLDKLLPSLTVIKAYQVRKKVGSEKSRSASANNRKLNNAGKYL